MSRAGHAARVCRALKAMQNDWLTDDQLADLLSVKNWSARQWRKQMESEGMIRRRFGERVEGRSGVPKFQFTLSRAFGGQAE